jgi:hypothetical protein
MDLGRLGTAVGERASKALGPLARVGAGLRHARLFHADGVILRGRVDGLPGPADLAALGARLEGHALVRLSAAFFRGHGAHPDVLGAAVRFTHAPDAGPAPGAHDQDLLLATVKHPWTLLPALLTTDTRDWLRNTYFGVLPYAADRVGRVRLRLVPAQPAPEGVGGDRVRRLLGALDAGPVPLTLEALPEDARRLGWVPVARLHLTARAHLPPGTLRFSPFRDGRGVRPVGLLHGLRLGPYRESQKGWPGGDAVPAPA